MGQVIFLTEKKYDRKHNNNNNVGVSYLAEDFFITCQSP